MRSWIHAELEKSGYNLLEASDGADALLIAELHQGEIDLVVTDVVMPRVNGPELVKELCLLRPGVKVLYMSGYTADLIAQQGILDPQMLLLEKPFTKEALLRKVRRALDGDLVRAATAGH